MRLIFLTLSLIGSIYGGEYHLTYQQVVLMGLRPMRVLQSGVDAEYINTQSCIDPRDSNTVINFTNQKRFPGVVLFSPRSENHCKNQQ